MSKPTTVDEYIQNAPSELKGKLITLRKAIRDIVPSTTEEKISYGMPYYGYKGRLAYFSYAKNHIGLYLVPPVVADHADELKDYKTSTSTVRFPLDKELPIALIQKLIRARIKINDQANHDK